MAHGVQYWTVRIAYTTQCGGGTLREPVVMVKEKNGLWTT